MQLESTHMKHQILIASEIRPKSQIELHALTCRNTQINQKFYISTADAREN